MRKILLIIRREYLTRVRKRSFIVMTILGPVLMAAIVIVPYFLATLSNDHQTVGVIDETGLFKGQFRDSENFTFHYLETDLWSAKEAFGKGKDDALLYIPKTELALPTNGLLYSGSQVGLNLRSYIRTVMTKRLEDLKLEARLQELNVGSSSGIDVQDLLKSVKTTVDINTIRIDDDGKETKSYSEVYIVLALVSGILIYFFIFLFGTQVMRGVIEEKTNRIVEVIVSSVKPFQLMMGKIIGVGMVGLTQFLLWVVLTFVIITAVTSLTNSGEPVQTLPQNITRQQTNGFDPNQVINLGTQSKPATEAEAILDAIGTIDFPVMIGSFLFYFIFGYLMFGALFAAIGGAVDSETDTQQFMLPITVPLILSIVVAQSIIQNPDSSLAVWLSMIPLTSPIVMMLRIPYGVPLWEVGLSMLLLVLGFLFATWLAGRIYRTGILMYGKKPGWRDIGGWVRGSR